MTFGYVVSGPVDSHIHAQILAVSHLECDALLLASSWPSIHTEGAIFMARRGRIFMCKYTKYFGLYS